MDENENGSIAKLIKKYIKEFIAFFAGIGFGWAALLILAWLGLLCWNPLIPLNCEEEPAGRAVPFPENGVGSKVQDVQTTTSPAPSIAPLAEPPMSEPLFMVLDDGYHVWYTGPRQAQTGGILAATFEIRTPDNMQPAKGRLTAIVGNSPSDQGALHAVGPLDDKGKVKLLFDIYFPPGETNLYIKHEDRIYLVTPIFIF